MDVQLNHYNAIIYHLNAQINNTFLCGMFLVLDSVKIKCLKTI